MVGDEGYCSDPSRDDGDELYGQTEGSKDMGSDDAFMQRALDLQLASQQMIDISKRVMKLAFSSTGSTSF